MKSIPVVKGNREEEGRTSAKEKHNQGVTFEKKKKQKTNQEAKHEQEMTE